MRNLGRNVGSSIIIAATMFVALSLNDAHAQQCAQPVSTGAAPVASDCLYILGAAVGSKTCSPACICAPTGGASVKATDALLCLSKATGQPVTLNCPCDDDPPDADRIIGEASASRDTTIFPPFFPGLPTTVTEDFYLDASFTKIEIIGDPPDVDITETVETFGPCTVTTIDSTVPNGGTPSFTITNYDPGDPGQAANGTVSVDLVRESGGGFEWFSPDPDSNPYGLGFDGGQTVTFSWPGGNHIQAFSDSIAVPPAIEITSPNLESDGFDVTPGQAIDLTWVPGSDDDGKLTVTIATSITELTAETVHVQSVTVVCLFTDANGAGTIPSGATADLQDPPASSAFYSRSLYASRENTKEVNVNAPSVGGSRVVLLTGRSAVTRSLYFDFPFQRRLVHER